MTGVILLSIIAFCVLTAVAAAAHAGWLGPAAKQGHNDLSRWKAFGGTLKRPPPPAPFRPTQRDIEEAARRWRRERLDGL